MNLLRQQGEDRLVCVDDACVDKSFLLKQEKEKCNGAACAVTALRAEVIFYREEAEANLQSRVRWELAANTTQFLFNSCEQERFVVDSKLNVCQHRLRAARQLSELTDSYRSLRESRESLHSVQDARSNDIKNLDSCLARRGGVNF